MGPSSQFSTKPLQRTQHFYGFFYVQIVFSSVGETKRPTRKSKEQRNSLSCESKLLTKSGWRQGLEPAINKIGTHASDALSTTPTVEIMYISILFYDSMQISIFFYTYRLRIGLQAGEEKNSQSGKEKSNEFPQDMSRKSCSGALWRALALLSMMLPAVVSKRQEKAILSTRMALSHI